jgi:hypothetical protein
MQCPGHHGCSSSFYLYINNLPCIEQNPELLFGSSRKRDRRSVEPGEALNANAQSFIHEHSGHGLAFQLHFQFSPLQQRKLELTLRQS